MTADDSSSPHTASIIEGLETQGWALTPGFLLPQDARDLASESQSAWDEGEFHRAKVGRGSGLTIREDVRSDHVMWLRSGEIPIAQQRYLDAIDILRHALNRHFFLGVSNFEAHFAVYPEGAFYKPHLDRHKQTSDRIVTVILYLNEFWEPDHGGELKLFTSPQSQVAPFKIIPPRLGTLVTFLAGDHWHEVLPAQKTRMSITGWLRTSG